MKALTLVHLNSKVYLLVIILFISSCSHITSNKTDEEKERLVMQKNKVKRITEYQTSFFGALENKEQLSRVKVFDKNGLKIKEEQYMDGSIDCVISNEYDKEDNLILSIGLNTSGGLVYKETRSYDKDNNRKELVFYLPDGTFKYKNFSVYDKEGKLIERNWYRPDGFKAKNKFTYNGLKKIEDTEYAPDGSFRYKWVYRYDAKDNLTEAVQYYPNDIINAKITYQYNHYNQLVKQTDYFGDSIQDIVTFEYDKKTLLLSVKTEYTPNEKISSRYKYQYEFY